MNFKSLTKDNYYKFIVILGLICSIMWVVFVKTKPFSDFQYYYDVALNVANGQQWGDTYTSIGYSIILGGLFKIFGASILVAKVFNVFLVTLNSIMFIEILDKFEIKSLDKKIIFTLFVFFPNNIFYTSLIANELLFTTILLLITVIYFSDFKYKFIYIGILTGINTMIKPFFIIFFLAIFIVELLINKKILKSLKDSIIVLLFCVIVISPWIYRNSKLVGQFTFVSNNGGIVLYINNNSQNSSGRWMNAEDVENSIVKTEAYKNANMTEKNKMLGSAAKKWILSHPKEFLSLGYIRLRNTFFLGDDIYYTTSGTNLSTSCKDTIFSFTNNFRKIIFAPAILYIFIYSILILKSIFERKTHLLNKYNLYTIILFYMFTSIYFVTEGQGRYAFPLIFIFVYYFYYFTNYFIVKTKILNKISNRNGGN